MPRSARIDIPNILQHVIVRGIEKREIFTDDEDRRRFVKRLSNLLVSTDTDCFAWALLSNHLHLLLRPRKTTLGNFMKRLLTGYAVSFNLRHKRLGHLFQNRYKSIVCEEESYLLELVRYIHLNPLRAGIVSSLEELALYPWSGHAVLLGNMDLPGQTTAEVLSRFSKSPKRAREIYRMFIADGVATEQKADLVGAGMEVRRDNSEGVRDSRVLGGEDFVEKLLQQTEGPPRKAKIPLEEIIEQVCAALHLPMSEVTSKRRTKRISDARGIICHIAISCDHSGTKVAGRLSITPSGVSIAAQRGKELVAENSEIRGRLPLHPL